MAEPSLRWLAFEYAVKPNSSPFVAVHLVDEDWHLRCGKTAFVPQLQYSRLVHVMVCFACLEISEWVMNHD